MPDVAFAAYPSAPAAISTAFSEASKLLRGSGIDLETWEQKDIAGRFIVEGVLDSIDSATFVVADLSRLNFNVVYEIGYAISRGKRVVLTLNKAVSPPKRELTELGIFDTLGYEEYENGQELKDIISSIENTSPIHFPPYEIETAQPIYLLDTLHKTDASLKIFSKLKKARVGLLRTFDPKEISRMTTLEAYKGVMKSAGVVVNLVPKHDPDYEFNNLRGAFVSGLALGAERECLIFQEGDHPVPLDYRDLVIPYKNPSDVEQPIGDFIPLVTQRALERRPSAVAATSGFLSQIDLGSPAAENEIDSLSEYYVATDEFDTVLRGNTRLAVGRKGSGKTALFFQVRDKVRSDKSNIVLDLKPEGHQLLRFKGLVLRLLDDTVRDHVVSAFWEYLLLMEICKKVLDTDRVRHMRDHRLTEPYQKLRELLPELRYEEGDFSERMLRLVNRVSDSFQAAHANETGVVLKPSQVTELIYQRDISEVSDILANYLTYKNGVFILIDNIDKSWPTRGIEAIDIVMLRSLLEATRKLERPFRMSRVPYQSTVFIRNDVYELLVDETADRGKESRVSLDWTDTDLLREFLRRRIVHNEVVSDVSFEEAWRAIAISHIDGEDSAEYLIRRSMMRPRNLLNLVNHCRTSAINLQHDKIDEGDLHKACNTFSADVCNELSLEIRDVFPYAEDILYEFIGFGTPITLYEVREILKEAGIDAADIDKLIEILLWFGFLGLHDAERGEEDGLFIFDVYYNMKKLKALAKNLNDESVLLSIHLAFRPFLEITSHS